MGAGTSGVAWETGSLDVWHFWGPQCRASSGSWSFGCRDRCNGTVRAPHIALPPRLVVCTSPGLPPRRPLTPASEQILGL